ncbi:hypothetical protein BGZ61DRAFT_465320 [Ilyonectria robusta]|uniref:uncharacterized protein n=1 Tax=Ilyonectria robusta TaxID=1079257 RepID=UPI001E8E2FC8|nr:uncharacterized protein BGZ61DRAFT_465320 [Ilyonectria robusta]KAH8659423.1 hypothetical protein BGZ61DRAFT_465320 [Ilyonectria robusta]
MTSQINVSAKVRRKTVQAAIIAARLPPRLTRSTANITYNPPSIRQLAARFNVTKAAVEKAIKVSSSPNGPVKKCGRPLALTPDEEVGLVGCIIWLEKTGYPAEKG